MDNRQRAIYLSRVRVGIGLAMLGMPRASGRALVGRGADSPAAATVSRMLGGRERLRGAAFRRRHQLRQPPSIAQDDAHPCRCRHLVAVRFGLVVERGAEVDA